MRSCALIECERRARWLYWFVALTVTAWLSLLILAPWLMATRRALPALVLYRVFALVCHQLPERSFSWWQAPLPVCARCTGIYLGFAAGWLLSVQLPPMRRAWLWLACLPLVIDGWLGVTGWWVNTPTSRMLTGLCAGSAVGWWLGSHRHSIVKKTDSGEALLHG
jgi:uncharacterized membrane protein